MPDATYDTKMSTSHTHTHSAHVLVGCELTVVARLGRGDAQQRGVLDADQTVHTNKHEAPLR